VSSEGASSGKLAALQNLLDDYLNATLKPNQTFDLSGAQGEGGARHIATQRAAWLELRSPSGRGAKTALPSVPPVSRRAAAAPDGDELEQSAPDDGILRETEFGRAARRIDWRKESAHVHDLMLTAAQTSTTRVRNIAGRRFDAGPSPSARGTQGQRIGPLWMMRDCFGTKIACGHRPL
jgi:hypothetical protein